MARFLVQRVLLLGFLLACITALSFWGHVTASASPTAQMSSAASPVPTEHVWVGNPLADSAGRLSFGSYEIPSTYSLVAPFVPLPTTTKTVKSIRLLALDSFGAYGSGVYLRCEVRDFQGNILRTISMNDIDVEAAPPGTWIDVPLSSNPADLVLGLGEYLAAYSYPAAGPGGNYYRFASLLAELK